MASNPFFSGRIPQRLLDAIEAHRKQTGESKTDVLTRALAKYVQFELEENKPVIPPIQQTFEEIFRRLEALENNKPVEKIRKEPKIKQFEINTNKEAITNNNSNDDNKKITVDNSNEIQILNSEKTIAHIGASISSLNSWKQKNLLPKTFKNKKTKQVFEIDFDEERSEEKKRMWRVQLIDNNDN